MSETMDQDRYALAPMKKLLDCYVLWAIGHLAPEQDARLTALEPKLRASLGQHGDWRAIVVGSMRWPPNIRELIREVWVKRRVAQPDPVEFAEKFVDASSAVAAR